MKCTVCQEEVEFGGCAIAVITGETHVLSLCELDAERIMTRKVMRQLRRIAGRAAWVQNPLPPPVGRMGGRARQGAPGPLGPLTVVPRPAGHLRSDAGIHQR